MKKQMIVHKNETVHSFVFDLEHPYRFAIVAAALASGTVMVVRAIKEKKPKAKRKVSKKTSNKK